MLRVARARPFKFRVFRVFRGSALFCLRVLPQLRFNGVVNQSVALVDENRGELFRNLRLRDWFVREL